MDQGSASSADVSGAQSSMPESGSRTGADFSVRGGALAERSDELRATWKGLLDVADMDVDGRITADEFLRRSAAHDLDAQRGTAMIWLIIDDSWKRRATEEISLPRIHAVQTQVHVDVDVSVVRRQGVRPDAENLYWLPVLASPADTPAIIGVVDQNGAAAPRLTQYETRWNISAALADLVVRSARTVLTPLARRDVELLLAAQLRRMLNRATARRSSGESPEDEPPQRSDHLVDQSTLRRTEQRIRDAQENLIALFPLEDREVVNPEQLHVVQLIHQICRLKLLFVGCDASTRRASFSASMPIRSAKAHLPADSTLREDERVFAALAGKVLREGPGPGRATFDLALSAFSASPNYHVVVNLPSETEALDASLDVKWQAAARLSTFVTRADIAAQFIRRLKSPHGVETEPPNRIVIERLFELLLSDLSQLHDLERSLEATQPMQDGPRSSPDDGVPSVSPQLRKLATLLERFDFESDAGQKAIPTSDEATYAQLDEIADVLQVVVGADAQNFDRDRSFTEAEETPERIHLNVRSNEQLPADADISSARVRFKIHLADPLPHSATNLVNRLNLYVVALIGVLATGTVWWTVEDKIETSAAVAVLLVFTGILAARIERPGRTSIRGWLARTPYVLGYFSTAPAVLASVVLVTSIWEVPEDPYQKAIILGATFVVAAIGQALLLTLGVAALGSAVRWTHPGQRARRSVFGSAAAALRWLTPEKLIQSLWFTPEVRSELPEAVHVGDAVSKLRSTEIRDFLAEALARSAGRRADRILTLSMHDSSSKLMRFLESDPPGAEGPTGTPVASRLDISGTLGVSFAGYALVHMVASAAGPPNVGPFQASTSKVLEINSMSDESDHVRTAPIRSYHEIFELMVRIDQQSTSPPEFARTFAARAAKFDLPILLLHFPAIPPRWTERVEGRNDDIWVRVRVGVSLQRQASFFELVQLTAGTLGRDDLRVMTVAEFHRPRPDTTGDRYLSFVEPSLRSSAPGGQVGFVMAHAIDRTGLISDVLEHLARSASVDANAGGTGISHLDRLRGASFATVSGIGLLTCYIEGTVSDDLGESVTAAMRSEAHNSPTTDARAFAKSFNRRAWPTSVRHQREVEGPVLRLTWNAPDRPGVLHALLGSLGEFKSAQPNLMYVLSRIANVNSSQGRLLFRIVLDGPGGMSVNEPRLQELVEQITAHCERALTEFVLSTDHHGDGYAAHVLQRDVFVTVEVMRTAVDVIELRNGSSQEQSPSARSPDHTTSAPAIAGSHRDDAAGID